MQLKLKFSIRLLFSFRKYPRPNIKDVIGDVSKVVIIAQVRFMEKRLFNVTSSLRINAILLILMKKK